MSHICRTCGDRCHCDGVAPLLAMPPDCDCYWSHIEDGPEEEEEG